MGNFLCELDYDINFNEDIMNVKRLLIFLQDHSLVFNHDISNIYDFSDALVNCDKKAKISSNRLNGSTILDILNYDQIPIILNKDSICNMVIRESNCYYFTTLLDDKVIKLMFDLNDILVYYKKSNSLYVYEENSNDKISISSNYKEKYIFRNNCIVNDYYENGTKYRKYISLYDDKEYNFSDYIPSLFDYTSNLNIYYLDDFFKYVSFLTPNGTMNKNICSLYNRCSLYTHDNIRLDNLNDKVFDAKFPIVYNPLFPEEFNNCYFTIKVINQDKNDYHGTVNLRISVYKNI